MSLVSLELDVQVSEMATDAAAFVTLDPAKVQRLTETYQDDAPEFPVLKVEPGTSKNQRVWSDDLMHDIAEQINTLQPVAYQGHIKPEDDGYAFPPVQTIWLGATAKKEGSQTVLYVKGYNIPGSEIRDKKLVKSGIVTETSWRGKAAVRTVNGVQHIDRFVLESIDWSRKGKAGMKAGVVAIASEMNEGSDNDMEWAKVTLDDIRRENPALFDLMKAQVEADSATQVAEMKEKADKADEAETVFTKLRAVLKVDEAADVIAAVTDVVSKVEKIGAKEIRERISDILGGKIKDDRAKATVMRLLPVSEMEGLDDDKLAAKIDEVFESDEDIKSIVSEMGSGPAPLAHGRSSESRQSGGSKVGASGMVTVGRRKL